MPPLRFSGLASSGAWGCFDEFNRLVPEVLSVCSLQFKAITDGLKAHMAVCSDEALEDHSPTSIVIEDDHISLDPGCGVFITMNPGYLGRSELPEGLKVCCEMPLTCLEHPYREVDYVGSVLYSDAASPLLLESSLIMLQVLFRPITVMVPDLVLICENMLMAEGFIQAKTLASKFHEFYSLLRELLSKQVRFVNRLALRGISNSKGSLHAS